MDKICCVFKGDSAVDALRERDFTVEKVLIPFDRNREERILYRCKKCGGLVLFDYEEAAYFIVGENWDNAHVTASYYPVLEEDVRVEDGKTVFDWDALTARRHITAH